MQDFFDRYRLMEWATQLSHLVAVDSKIRAGKCSRKGLPPSSAEKFSAVRIGGREFTPRSAAEELERLLKDPDLYDDCWIELQDAVRAYRAARTPPMFRRAYKMFAYAVRTLQGATNALGTSHMGQQGWHNFLCALPGRKADLFMYPTNKRQLLPDLGQDPAELYADLSTCRLKKVDITLDESARSIQVGVRKECRPSPTQFRFFMILWNRCDRWVRVHDISKQLRQSENSNATCKLKERLVERLQEDGYADLAQHVRGVKGYYGLIFDSRVSSPV